MHAWGGTHTSSHAGPWARMQDHVLASFQKHNGIVALARPIASRKNACRANEESLVFHTVHVIGYMAPWTNACERYTIQLNMEVKHADNVLVCKFDSHDISVRAPKAPSMHSRLCLKCTVCRAAKHLLDQLGHGLRALLFADQKNPHEAARLAWPETVPPKLREALCFQKILRCPTCCWQTA